MNHEFYNLFLCYFVYCVSRHPPLTQRQICATNQANDSESHCLICMPQACAGEVKRIKFLLYALAQSLMHNFPTANHNMRIGGQAHPASR